MRNVDDAERSAQEAARLEPMESKRVICWAALLLSRRTFRQLRNTSGRPSLRTDSLQTLYNSQRFCCHQGRAERAAEVFRLARGAPSAQDPFLLARTGECYEQGGDHRRTFSPG